MFNAAMRRRWRRLVGVPMILVGLALLATGASIQHAVFFGAGTTFIVTGIILAARAPANGDQGG